MPSNRFYWPAHRSLFRSHDKRGKGIALVVCLVALTIIAAVAWHW